MGSYRIDPKKQFSKRLARWTAVFWFAYMIYLSTIMMMQPQAAQYSFYMGLLATVTMMVNVVSYTTNSIQEKILFAMLDKAKIEIGIGGKGGEAHEEKDLTPEEESNG
jgi:hypothetical protein